MKLSYARFHHKTITDYSFRQDISLIFLSCLNVRLILVLLRCLISDRRARSLSFGHSRFKSLQLTYFQTHFYPHFTFKKQRGKPHLPFQLHWSLEYWQKEIRQRRRRGSSREASIGVSMFISQLTSPLLERNCDEVHRRISSYIAFPCAPVRSVLLPGYFL